MGLKKILLGLVFVSTTLLSGCADMQLGRSKTSVDSLGRFKTSVDSLAQADAAAKKRYVLLPGGKGVEPADLQFQEFAAYVEKVLAEKGFMKVGAFEDADVAIFLAYAIGDPQTYQYTYSVPTWGQTGVSSSNTYGTVSSYGGMANYSGATTYTPTYGVTGSTTHIGTNIVYTRFLSLDTYDMPVYLKEKRLAQVWKTRVVSAGSSDDLRLVVPYMIAAMKPYLGVNTGRKIEVEVPVNDPAAQALRSSLLPTVK